MCLFFFFFNDTATTEIYTLSLHDALPIWFERARAKRRNSRNDIRVYECLRVTLLADVILVKVEDRKSTRLNSSHLVISYAVFCLKKKKNITARCPRLQRRPARHAPRSG